MERALIVGVGAAGSIVAQKCAIDGDTFKHNTLASCRIESRETDKPVKHALTLCGDSAIGMDEGTLVGLTTADFIGADVDDALSDLTYSVTNLANGVVQVNGVAATTFNKADLAGGKDIIFGDGCADTGTPSYETADSKVEGCLTIPAATSREAMGDTICGFEKTIGGLVSSLLDGFALADRAPAIEPDRLAPPTLIAEAAPGSIASPVGYVEPTPTPERRETTFHSRNSMGSWPRRVALEPFQDGTLRTWAERYSEEWLGRSVQRHRLGTVNGIKTLDTIPFTLPHRGTLA